MLSASLGSENALDSDRLAVSINWPIALLRVGLVGAGGLMIQGAVHVANSAPLYDSAGNIAFVLVGGLVGLSLLVGAGLRRPPEILKWTILLAYVYVVIVRSIVWAQTSESVNHVVVDQGIYTDLAAELIWNGQNPYQWDFSGSLDLYRIDTFGGTPNLDGALGAKYPYPALPLALTAPIQAVGLPGTFILSVALQIAALLLIYFAAPKAIQPVILFPIVAGFDLLGVTLIGSLDILWAVLLAAMVVAWKKPTLRAVLFGLAASSKQIPWLIAPFLIIRIWRDEGGGSPLHRAGRFAAISILTFLTVNGIFILKDVDAWLRGVTGPMRDDMVLLSHGGLSSITHLGLANLPRSYYLLVTLAVFGLLLFIYWRHHETLRNALWIFPGIFMWFSYRTLVTYWVFWVFPLVAALVASVPAAKKRSEYAPRLSSTLGAIAIVAAVLATLGIYLSSQPAQIEVQVLHPILVTQGRATRMKVEVANRSQSLLTPRFAFQRFPYDANPQVWRIDDGAASLQPGQTGIYDIFTNRHQATFIVHDAAQLVVTDARGNYSLRGMTTIGPDDSYLWPEAIANPTYAYWENNQYQPIWWGLSSSPAGSGSADLMNVEGREALRLSLEVSGKETSRVALENLTIFPSGPFGTWVYSDPPIGDPHSIEYGLEIDDGRHLLRFLFGSEEYSGPAEEGQYVVAKAVPLRTWILAEIDVAAAYDKAGWELPELNPSTYKGMDIPLRMVSLRLILAADTTQSEPLHAFFGPIVQDYRQFNPQDLMAETLDNPYRYYLNLAESYAQDRNYLRALQANERLLQFSPPEDEAHIGMDLVVSRDGGADFKQP